MTNVRGKITFRWPQPVVRYGLSAQASFAKWGNQRQQEEPEEYLLLRVLPKLKSSSKNANEFQMT